MKPVKFQNKYRIPSARAQWHDYNGGEYFVTICTRYRKHYFGEIRNHEMILSEIGKYAVDNLEQITRHYPNCTIPLYVVMPNHIHAIVIVADTIENNANHVETMCTSSKNTTVQDDRTYVETMCTSSKNTTVQDNRTYVETMCTSSLHNQRWKNGMVDKKMQSVSIKRGKLSTMVGGYKRAITRFANENKMDFGWQARFHDHIARDQEEMNRIADYIQNNVRRWKEDRFYSTIQINNVTHSIPIDSKDYLS